MGKAGLKSGDYDALERAIRQEASAIEEFRKATEKPPSAKSEG